MSTAADPESVNEGYERKVSSLELERSAGTFGDPARFMQMLPGVVSDNDERNDFLVRGGNPSETLFVIDNTEVPSINQLALSDTTGGFVSMIDNVAVQHMTLHTDSYDGKFDQRLSGVLEMSTRPDGPVSRHYHAEFGIGGAGASAERPLSANGSLFISVRRSVLNLFTNDIGINGVPIYNNALVRADDRIDEKNNWWGFSLTGIDSIAIHPQAEDIWETNPFDINYKGWRNTTGINWEHEYSAKSFAVTNVSNSEQQQKISQNAQLLAGGQVYYEDSRDGITTIKFDWTFQPKPRFTWTDGAMSSLDRMSYNIQQPIGLPNPYSSNPAPSDATAIKRMFLTSSAAAYTQAALGLPHGVSIVAGGRFSQWAILGSTAATGRVLILAPLFGRMFHVGYADYAQLPPSLYILAFANRSTTTPMRARHLTAGISIVDNRRMKLTVNTYDKLYSHYPVATIFPQLTMANIADTFGQAFLMFPMTSLGCGIARGIEGTFDLRPSRRLSLSSATTYMRSWYSGLDHVLRKGNFDMPLVANLSGTAELGRGWIASFRYGGSTGRPYTPDNLALSEAQGRDVYDLTQLNGLRAPAYKRLDFRAEWTHTVRRGSIMVYVGLENALGTSNFYSNQWRPRCTVAQGCGTLEQEQMPRFPDGGLRYFY